MIAFLSKKNLSGGFQQALWHQRKSAYTHASVIIGTGLAAAILTQLTFISGYFGYFKNLHLSFFVILGIFHLGYLNRQSTKKTKSGKNLFLTVSIVLILLSGLTIFYVIRERSLWYLAGSSIAAFLLPLIVWRQWELSLSIPDQRYAGWFPEDSIEKNKVSISLNSITIKISLSPTYFDPQWVSITTLQPYRKVLGQAFQIAVEEYNLKAGTPIELYDEKGQKYSWEFYREKYRGLGIGFLDPLSNVGDNKLKNNDRILARRIRT